MCPPFSVSAYPSVRPSQWRGPQLAADLLPFTLHPDRDVRGAAVSAAKRAVRSLPHQRAAVVSQACSAALRAWDDLAPAPPRAEDAVGGCVQLVRELVSEWRAAVSADPTGHSLDESQQEIARIEGALFLGRDPALELF